jgi:hypothetical protein
LPEQVITRLEERFWKLRTEQVERAVLHRYSEFQHSRIRDFLPILVGGAGEGLKAATWFSSDFQQAPARPLGE